VNVSGPLLIPLRHRFLRLFHMYVLDMERFCRAVYSASRLVDYKEVQVYMVIKHDHYKQDSKRTEQKAHRLASK
jgi:protein-disulfide isomerase-like protein with CxxC motif